MYLWYGLIVTGIVTKPWLWGNMSPNIQTCENWWSYFPENVRILVFKSLDLTLFLSPNQSIYFNFVRCWGKARPSTAPGLGFYKRAADFYEWFIHKMCILDTDGIFLLLKKMNELISRTEQYTQACTVGGLGQGLPGPGVDKVESD